MNEKKSVSRHALQAFLAAIFVLSIGLNGAGAVAFVNLRDEIDKEKSECLKALDTLKDELEVTKTRNSKVKYQLKGLATKTADLSWWREFKKAKLAVYLSNLADQLD